jgi:3-hydroxybutyryl-CoA dehydrogenase
MSERTPHFAIVGAGTMGHAIAQVVACAGGEVALHDVDVNALARALDRIAANLQRAVERGKLDAAGARAAQARVRAVPTLAAAVADADVVIESVPESLPLKQQVMAEIAQHAPATALLATNTSSLSIAKIAAATAAADRVVGLHFFNPAYAQALVEVVSGPATSVASRERALALARELGKEPIAVKDTPGFATSRLGIVLGLEAMRMVEQGVATPAEIDRAVELGCRHHMGPLRTTDLIGLDVRLAIAETLFAELGGEQFRPPQILRDKVAAGELGQKSGRGFFDWPEHDRS